MADRLGDERRAIGTRIEKERRSYDNGAARRANGDRIARERTGADVQEDINSLVRPVVMRKQLTPIPARGALPAANGRAPYKAPASQNTGSGVAWPLTEADFTKREYWPGGAMTSDGIFMIPAIKKIELTDADGAVNSVHLAEPV